MNIASEYKCSCANRATIGSLLAVLLSVVIIGLQSESLLAHEDTFYRFMDIGLRVPFSTGTDWFIYDFSRVYVEVDEPLTVERWLDGLEKGRTFITNGPLLKFSLGEYNPGDVVRLAQPRELNISSRAVGRCDFQKIEVIYNGRVVQSAPSRSVGGHFEARITALLWLSEPGWVALRISSEQKNELGAPLFGHTGAVYVEIAGKTVFKPEVANIAMRLNRRLQWDPDEESFINDEQANRLLSKPVRTPWHL